MLRLLALFTLLLLGACSRAPEKLIIGTDATYPPFEFKDEAGNFSGVSIDLGTALAQYLGRPVEFQNIAFDGLIPALQSGSIDLIICVGRRWTSLTPTRTRVSACWCQRALL